VRSYDSHSNTTVVSHCTAHYCSSTPALTMATKERNLHDAIRDSALEEAQLLIVKGSDINERDRHSRTPLHLACWKGDYPMIQLLVRSKADLNARAMDKFTHLHFLAQSGCVPGIKLMVLKNRSILNARSKGNKSALHLAAAKDGNIETVKCLVECGIDVLGLTSQGSSAADLAKNPETKDFLLEAMEAKRQSLEQIERQTSSSKNMSAGSVDLPAGGHGHEKDKADDEDEDEPASNLEGDQPHSEQGPSPSHIPISAPTQASEPLSVPATGILDTSGNVSGLKRSFEQSYDVGPTSLVPPSADLINQPSLPASHDAAITIASNIGSIQVVVGQSSGGLKRRKGNVVGGNVVSSASRAAPIILSHLNDDEDD
jgi:Ankyrin repeats (3 copies)